MALYLGFIAHVSVTIPSHIEAWAGRGVKQGGRIGMMHPHARRFPVR